MERGEREPGQREERGGRGVKSVKPRAFKIHVASTGFGWEGIRQVCATLLVLGARHVPERLCGGIVY